MPLNKETKPNICKGCWKFLGMTKMRLIEGSIFQTQNPKVWQEDVRDSSRNMKFDEKISEIKTLNFFLSNKKIYTADQLI